MTATIGRGYNTSYLTNAVATGREDYYSSAVTAGEPVGQWSGAGAAAIGLVGDVDADQLSAIYHHLLDPRDPRSANPGTWGEADTLGEPPYRYKSAEVIYRDLLANEHDPTPERRDELRRQAESSQRQPLAFLDVTFGVQKSVSLLGVAHERAAQNARRAGDTGLAEHHAAQARAVEEAVRAGSTAMLAHLEDVAGLARTGHHGGGAGRWEDAHQWVIASFLQHDSRSKDPHLHIHNAILNRQLCVDGKWRALDSKAIHRERGAAGAIGERVMEAKLTELLGVTFEWRQDGKVREVVGVSSELCKRFSARNTAVTERAAKILTAFAAKYNRDPSPAERYKIMSQSWAATRAAKSKTGENIEARLDRWASEAARETNTGLAEVLSRVADAVGEVPTWSPRDIMLRGIELAAERKGAWTRSDLTRAISDRLPANLGIPAEDIPDLLNGLAEQALGHAVRLSHVEEAVPEHLRRTDGSSQYDGKEVYYAAPWTLQAEKALMARAVARGGEVFTASEINRVLASVRVDGRELGADQARAIQAVLGGGACVDVIKAAAGTGKSFVVGVLAGAWTDQRLAPHSPARRVFGLTTSQNAANVLAGEGLTNTANIKKWSDTQERLDAHQTGETDEDWRLRADDLVVVDEAGMVTTADLANIAARCERAGAKLLLTGDPRQLGAVGPGGALQDLFSAAPTHELVEVRRFTAQWEREASLRLRDGDTSVIGEYAVQGRLFDGGTVEQTEAKAARGWLNDHLQGLDTVLVVTSNESATGLNAELRAQLVRIGHVAEAGVHLGKYDEVAGVGDLITARQNNRQLGPVNREQFRVIETHADGSMTAARVLGRFEGTERLATAITLPVEYVSEHVSLGYASTAHSVQGRTVDTSHSVITAGSDAGSVYVPMTRGRDCNSAYAVTQQARQETEVGEVQEIEPRTPEAVMADAMTRRDDVTNRAATAVAYESEELAASVGTNLNRMSTELREVTAGRSSAMFDRLVAEGRLSVADRHALAVDQRGLELVDRLLRGHELAGRNPEPILIDAVAGRGFGDARNAASVLYHRLASQKPDLQPVMADYTALVPGGLDEASRERFIGLASAADDRRRELGARTVADPPAWATWALGAVPTEPTAKLEWERKAGWASGYREYAGWTDELVPLGPDPGAVAAEQRAAWRVAHAELNLADSRAEEAELSEAQHRARIAGWDHERKWAPAHVDDEAAATARQASKDEQSASIWTEYARTRPTELGTDELRTMAVEARDRGEAERAKHQELLAARAERGRWVVHTAVTRDKAERSEAHLKAMGIDPSSSDGRVHSDEWLAEHRREQAESEVTREVTEADVPIAETDDATPAGPETAVPDIRETAVRHLSEDTDSKPRDRVPDNDEVAAVISRAADAAREMATRDEAERYRWDDVTGAADEAADEDVLY